MFFRIICFLFCVLVLNGRAFADVVASPKSSLSFSEDGKVVYVNWLYEKNPINFDHKKYKFSESEFSLDNYPQSGLYITNGRKFLWRLEGKYKGYYVSAKPLNDQQHMVVFGPWASHIENEAFSLYRNGKLIREFRVKDFCTDKSTFDYTGSYIGAHFEWMDDFELDDSKKVITFVSCRKYFTVDIKSGVFSTKRKYFNPDELLSLLINFSLLSFVIFPVSLGARIYLAFTNKGSDKQRKSLAIVAIISFVLMVLCFISDT